MATRFNVGDRIRIGRSHYPANFKDGAIGTIVSHAWRDGDVDCYLVEVPGVETPGVGRFGWAVVDAPGHRIDDQLSLAKPISSLPSPTDPYAVADFLLGD